MERIAHSGKREIEGSDHGSATRGKIFSRYSRTPVRTAYARLSAFQCVWFGGCLVWWLGLTTGLRIAQSLAMHGLIIFCLLLVLPNIVAKAGEKPNIIVIMADDLGYNDLSCYGQKNFETPALDRMAREGLRFTTHYAGATVCLPSRCALMTGRDMGHASIRGNGDHTLDPAQETLLPMALRQAGYRTAMIGKSSVHSTQDPTRPEVCCFDHFFGYLVHKAAHNHYPELLWRNGKEVPIDGNKNRRGSTYAEDLFHAEALQWIEANQTHPFFLMLSLAVPHADVSAPDEAIAPFRGKFKEQSLPQGSYAPTHEPLATHAAMVTRMDASIGRLLDFLRQRGLEKDTLVIFTSDNGGHSEGGHHYAHFQSNAPFRGGKRDLYEGGLRVPMLAWWPGTIQPRVSGHISASWDIFPTLAELAGIPPPKPSEGLSFAPLVLGQGKQPEHVSLYWEFHEMGGKQAARMGRWKIVRLNVQSHPAGKPELYDLENDPGETTDLADQEPAILARMIEIFSHRQPSAKRAWNF